MVLLVAGLVFGSGIASLARRTPDVGRPDASGGPIPTRSPAVDSDQAASSGERSRSVGGRPTTPAMTTTSGLASLTTSGSAAGNDVPARPAPPTDIREFIGLAGDQAVVVPAGTYSAGSVTAPHPRTSGRLGGWLVLVSETPGGAVVDLSGGDLVLEARTSRVMFVGLAFRDGAVRAKGTDLRFWHTTHTFPVEVWAAEPEPRIRRVPRTLYVTHGATRVGFHGSEIHDVGDDGLLVNNASDVLVEGVRITRVNEKSYDPQDLIHNDAIQTTGRVSRLQIRDSELGAALWVGTERSGDVSLSVENTWLHGSVSVGIGLAAKTTDDGVPLRVVGRRSDVVSFGHNSGRDRADFVDGVQRPPGSRPGRVVMEDRNVRTDPPPSTAVSPALEWRARNPYASWARFFTATESG
jgi:hypothetical protein